MMIVITLHTPQVSAAKTAAMPTNNTRRDAFMLNTPNRIGTGENKESNNSNDILNMTDGRRKFM